MTRVNCCCADGSLAGYVSFLARTINNIQLLGMENVGKLALTIPGHGRFPLKRGVSKIDATLWGKPCMPIRSDIDDSYGVFRRLGGGGLKEREKMEREEPVGQVVGLDSESGLEHERRIGEGLNRLEIESHIRPRSEKRVPP